MTVPPTIFRTLIEHIDAESFLARYSDYSKTIRTDSKFFHFVTFSIIPIISSKMREIIATVKLNFLTIPPNKNLIGCHLCNKDRI